MISKNLIELYTTKVKATNVGESDVVGGGKIKQEVTVGD